jgi:nucleoside 2-deoxyribosyltransferase
MKIFISYKFAGEDPGELEKTLNEISNVLKGAGHEIYSASEDEKLFIEKKFTLKKILNHALEKLNNSDCILVFVRSYEKSEGMLLEIGYALAKKKKMILAIKKGIRLSFTEEIADKVIEFTDINDLKQKLKEIK